MKKAQRIVSYAGIFGFIAIVVYCLIVLAAIAFTGDITDENVINLIGRYMLGIVLAISMAYICVFIKEIVCYIKNVLSRLKD